MADFDAIVVGSGMSGGYEAKISSAMQNPFITYMVLSARAANHVADLIERGEL